MSIRLISWLKFQLRNKNLLVLLVHSLVVSAPYAWLGFRILFAALVPVILAECMFDNKAKAKFTKAKRTTKRFNLKALKIYLKFLI